MLTTPDPSRPGVDLIGGDMLMWSDFDPGSHDDDLTRMPESAEIWRLALKSSLGRVRGRALVIGAEAAKCLDFFPKHLDVDVVIRSRVDAGLVAAGFPGAHVYCGSVHRFATTIRYDLVIVLDDAAALLTPDDEPTSAASLVATMSSWVAPNGAFVCKVANRVGLDVLLGEHAGDAWSASDPRMALHELIAVEPDATLLALAGNPPELLVSAEVAEDSRLKGLISVSMTAALGGADLGLIRDPLAVVPAVVEAGDFARLCPAWLVARGMHLEQKLVANAGGALSDAWDTADTEEVQPDAEAGQQGATDLEAGRSEVTDVSETEGSAPLKLTYGHEWRRWFTLGNDGAVTVISDPRSATSLGPLWRSEEESVTFLGDTKSLEGVWRAAASTRQLEPLRDLVREWSEWVDEQDPPARWFASPHNVVVGAKGLGLLDTTWGWQGKEDPEAAKVLSLRRFAKRLLESGATHPWPANVSLDGVAESLALMAGVGWSTETLTTAITVGERIRALSTTGDESSLLDRVQRSLIAGRRHQLAIGSAFARSAQERLLNQFANEAEAQEIKVLWYERHVRRRDGQLEGLERQLASIEASPPYKVARAITWPGRAAIRSVKGVVKRALPPSAWRRLIGFAKEKLR